jgi:hypothetical protein
MMPENTDVSEIDKLTGVPRHKGKFLKLVGLVFYTCCGDRSATICRSHAGPVQYNQHEQVQGESAARHVEKRPCSEDYSLALHVSVSEGCCLRVELDQGSVGLRHDNDSHQQL